MSVPLRRLGRAFSLSLMTSALLAACGGSSDDLGPVAAETPAPVHEHTAIETAGRLAILEDQSRSVRILDLDGDTVSATFSTTHLPSAIQASPGGRHAVVMQNSGGLVEFIDGGLWQEDHGDHLHDYREAPRRLNFSISGARPSHYQVHEDIGAVFMDGLAGTGETARVQILTEAGLEAGLAEASLTLSVPVHGTAEPRGAHLLVSVRDEQSTGTLPDLVEVHRREGSALVRVQGFPQRCPSLHGSASTTRHTAFGCLDGVLLVSETDGVFSARHLAAPASLPTGARISTVVAHPARDTLIGIAAPGLLFEIDPAAGEIRPIAWAEGRTRRSHGFDAEGGHFLVLDDLGTLHVLDATAAWAVKASLPVLRSMPDAAPFPALTAGTGDQIYLTDPVGRQVAVVDLKGPALGRQIPLDFRPTGLTWLGFHHDDH